MSKRDDDAHQRSHGAPMSVQDLATLNQDSRGSKERGLDLGDNGHGSNGHGDVAGHKNVVAKLLSRMTQVTIFQGRVYSPVKIEMEL